MHLLETSLYFAPNSCQVVYVAPQHTPNPSLSLSSCPPPLPLRLLPRGCFSRCHCHSLCRCRSHGCGCQCYLCSRRCHICRFCHTCCCFLLIVVCPCCRHSCHNAMHGPHCSLCFRSLPSLLSRCFHRHHCRWCLRCPAAAASNVDVASFPCGATMVMNYCRE